jgi:(S)-ureidoglycine aminohydrolase
MQHLGQTRSAQAADHLLQTPDTFVRSPMPGIVNGMAVVHVSPARGARFRQYTAELQPGGLLKPAATQRFAYVLEGEALAGAAALEPGGYVYLPAGCGIDICAASAARLAVIEKSYEPLQELAPPAFFTGSESRVESQPLDGNAALQVRCLVPAETAFDFAVNTMTFQPGASLHMVEMHAMEHGLLILEGGGIYRLGDKWYPVTAGDFIWMAPYCPQWFGALGEKPAKYLIYKDWNR